MNIVVERPLQDFMINHEHHILTLRMKEDWDVQHRTYTHPQISYKTPKDVERFESYKVDDITIYVEQGIRPESDTLKFDDRRILGVHKPHVSGIHYELPEPLKLL